MLQALGQATPKAGTPQLCCPKCGAGATPHALCCWLCQAHFPRGPAHRCPLPSAKKPHASFSLATLLLFMSLVSVCCALVTVVPWMGIPLSLLALPALVRAGWKLQQQTRYGHRAGIGQRIYIFLESWALMVIIAVITAGIIACMSGLALAAVIFADPIFFSGTSLQYFVPYFVVGSGALFGCWLSFRLWKDSL